MTITTPPKYHNAVLALNLGGTNVDATTSISSIAATAEIAGTEPNSEAANIPVIVAAVVNEASEPSQSLTVQDNNKDQVCVLLAFRHANMFALVLCICFFTSCIFHRTSVIVILGICL